MRKELELSATLDFLSISDIMKKTLIMPLTLAGVTCIITMGCHTQAPSQPSAPPTVNANLAPQSLAGKNIYLTHLDSNIKVAGRAQHSTNPADDLFVRTRAFACKNSKSEVGVDCLETINFQYQCVGLNRATVVIENRYENCGTLKEFMRHSLILEFTTPTKGNVTIAVEGYERTIGPNPIIGTGTFTIK